MHLILDGEERHLDTSECANLAELVELAEACDANEGASVVVAVEVDGEPLSPDALSGLESHSLDGVSRISIVRRPTWAVARSVLEQGADYTGQICRAIDETVEHFRSGRSDKGSAWLADITDSLTVLTGITYSAASILEDQVQALSEIQSEIFPWLQELVEAQTEADPLRIADLLEYEIKSRIEDWGTLMRSIAEETGKHSNVGEKTLSS